LKIRDSLDTAPAGERYHDRLSIPLKMSPYHLNQMERGEVKALQIFTDSSGKWWVTFAVRIELPKPVEGNLPVAVLGIDLGIEKAACTTLVRPNKVSETRYFRQNEKVERIKNLDSQVTALQKEMDTRRNSGQEYEKVALKLRRLKHKRENVAREYDRVLVSQLLDYISHLSENYTVYVSLGRLRGIRNSARRGNRKGKTFRGMVHRWAFARITGSLRHGLSQMGWKVDGRSTRFQAVSEAWTSIMCWKCGHKGTRPRQNLFVCPTCGNKCNADKNGAINIAARLITLTKSLHCVRGLGKWANAISRAKRSRPKARGATPQGKSLLSKEEKTSIPGESAVVRHVQMDLLGLGDKSKMGDNDSAVEKTVENLTAAGSDTLAVVQEKDTRSTGGISSQ
jgi:transposase